LTHIVSDPAGTASSAFVGFPTSQYTVAGKTGTAEVQSTNPDGTPKDPTAWFASYGGPAGQPAQYAVVVMVSQGAQGGVTAAPAVRQIYDGIWGLDGTNGPDDKFAAKGPALPNGAPPVALPNLMPAGAPSAAASSAPASAAPKALGADAARLVATEPDRLVGPPSSVWAR
jgi:penicillin-binding protein 2